MGHIIRLYLHQLSMSGIIRVLLWIMFQSASFLRLVWWYFVYCSNMLQKVVWNNMPIREPWQCEMWFFLLGGEHTVKFASCACEPLVVTMIRARIWPSSPQRPHLAFTFDLLDWAEALLLECQVPVEDFCKALQFKCRRLLVKVGIHNSLHNILVTLSCSCTSSHQMECLMVLTDVKYVI